MTKPAFETYWTVNGEQYFNTNEVASLVAAGHIAVEVPATKQAENWQRQQLLETWHRASQDKYAKYVQEQQFKESPEGRQQEAIRHAAQHPGGIVSSASHPAFHELDQYGPDATNAFK